MKKIADWLRDKRWYIFTLRYWCILPLHLTDVDEAQANNYIIKLSKMFIDKFEDYIKLLLDEIKSLPYYVNSYGSIKPLETIFKEYYLERRKYIEENFLDSDLVNEQDDIWK